MMYLQKNLNRALGGLIGLMLLLILSVELFFNFVSEVKQLGIGEYGLWEALLYLGVSLPGHLLRLFPMAALVGTLMGLNRLASHSELIAMQAAGVSIAGLVRMILSFGFVLVLVVGGIGEFLVPGWDEYAQQKKAFYLSSGQAIQTENGTWLRDGLDFIYMKKNQITLYQLDQDFQLKEAAIAQTMDYRHHQWILSGLSKTQFFSDHTEVKKESKAIWHSQLNPEVLKITTHEVIEQLSIRDLWRLMQFRKQAGLEVSPTAFMFWNKVLQPVTTLVMMFLGIPFIFGPLREASTGLRLLIGILLGFIFHLFNASFGPFIIVYALPAWIGVVFPTVFFLGIGIYLYRSFLRMS